MWGGEVDEGEVGVVDAAALAIGVVGLGEFLEVAGGPGIDAYGEHHDGEGDEDDQAETVSTGTLAV